jgi:hypothetical protein
MKNILQRLFRRRAETPVKEKGTAVEALMVFGTGFVIFLMVFMVTAGAFANIDSRWQARQIAREYLLVCETQGYLTTSDLDGMTQKLSDCGVTNVDYTGTTTAKVPYGSTITLHFKGKIADHVLLNGTTGISNDDIEIIRQSTAKQQE